MSGASAAKSWWRSLTVWGLIMTAIGSVISALGGEGDVGAAIEGAVASIMQAVGIGVAVMGRARAAAPLTFRDAPKVLPSLVALLGAGMLLTSNGGCATTLCPEGQGVVATYTARAPSTLAGRCSGDAPDRVRQRLVGDSRGTYLVRCPRGHVPGPRAGTTPAQLDDGESWVSELDCALLDPMPADPAPADPAPDDGSGLRGTQ